MRLLVMLIKSENIIRSFDLITSCFSTLTIEVVIFDHRVTEKKKFKTNYCSARSYFSVMRFSLKQNFKCLRILPSSILFCRPLILILNSCHKGWVVFKKCNILEGFKKIMLRIAIFFYFTTKFQVKCDLF